MELGNTQMYVVSDQLLLLHAKKQVHVKCQLKVKGQIHINKTTPLNDENESY